MAVRTLLRFHSGRIFLILLGTLLLPLSVNAQGSGKQTTGTGGSHVIQGYVFFPSGRRAEGTIIVKLESLQYGELQVVPDSSGAFTFSQLAPGNYTVVVTAGEDYRSRARVFTSIATQISGEAVHVSPRPQEGSR